MVFVLMKNNGFLIHGQQHRYGESILRETDMDFIQSTINFEKSK